MEVITNDKITDEVIDYKGLNPKNVLNTLQRLKDNYRLVLTLNLIEGYDYEEIAQILNYTNELMVNFFLKKKISFTDIVENNKKILEQFISNNNNIKNPNIDDISQSFATVDEYTSRLISN